MYETPTSIKWKKTERKEERRWDKLKESMGVLNNWQKWVEWLCAQNGMESFIHCISCHVYVIVWEERGWVSLKGLNMLTLIYFEQFLKFLVKRVSSRQFYITKRWFRHPITRPHKLLVFGFPESRIHIIFQSWDILKPEHLHPKVTTDSGKPKIQGEIHEVFL